MAEFTYPEEQNVPYGQAALLNNTTCGCNKNHIVHQNGFGGITLKGIVNNPYASYAQFEVMFSADIALAEGATVGEISAALSINGEVVTDTIASATPAAVGDFWHVSGFKTVLVPKDCCPMVAVENVSPAQGATPNPTIVMRYLNVSVKRIA